MKRKVLTRTEKTTAIAQLQVAERVLNGVLMDVLNGKVAAADLDSLHRLEQKVRAFRYRIEGYQANTEEPA